MPLDIQQMFAEFIPDTAKQDRNAGVDAANVVGQLGGQAALLAPARSRQLKQSVGGLFGLDTRSPAEKLRESLGGVDITTPAGQQQAFEMISAVDGTAGIKFRAAMAEQNIAKQNANSSQISAEAQRLNSETAQSGISIDQQRANTQEFMSRTQAAELTLGEQSQEDLQAWRSEQIVNQRRELAIREEANRIDEMMAQINQSNLGASDRKAIREATEEGRQLRAKANEATRIAGEFKTLQPLAGAASLVKEKWRELAGNQDEISLLRANFNALKNSLVMDSLPPGVASDKDIEIAMSGFPKESWSPEQLFAFTQGMAKVSALASEESFLRGQHLADNGGTDEGFDTVWQERLNSPEFQAEIEAKYGVTFEDDQEAVNERFNRTANDMARQAERELTRRRRLNNAAQQGLTL